MPWAGLKSAPAEARAAFIIMTTEEMVARTRTHAVSHTLNEQIAVKTLSEHYKEEDLSRPPPQCLHVNDVVGGVLPYS